VVAQCVGDLSSTEQKHKHPQQQCSDARGGKRIGVAEDFKIPIERTVYFIAALIPAGRSVDLLRLRPKPVNSN
jgi:hypothetical protein